MVPGLVKLMVLPGTTVAATPAVIGMMVPPVVMLPTVPVPETVIWLLPVALGGSVIAELAPRVTEVVPLELAVTGTVVAMVVGSAASVPFTPGTNPPTTRPFGTLGNGCARVPKLLGEFGARNRLRAALWAFSTA